MESALQVENMRRERRVVPSEEITCDFGVIQDLTSKGIYIISDNKGFSSNDPIRLTIKKDSGPIIKVKARVKRFGQDGIGVEIDKSMTDISDLNQFYLLVRGCCRRAC